MSSSVYMKLMKLDERLTLTAYIPISTQVMALIIEAAEGVAEIDATLSISDLSTLLNKICARMSGGFAVHQIASGDVQIMYEPRVADKTEFGVEYINIGFGETDKDSQNHLWINEKVLFAFMDRNLYGAAFNLYLYLGYLMTRDPAFAVSHNISFEEIVARSPELSGDCSMKYRTTLMRALADLQDAGLLKWHAKTCTFKVLHITPYDLAQKV